MLADKTLLKRVGFLGWQVSGHVTSAEGQKVYALGGRWNEYLDAQKCDEEGDPLPDAETIHLWKVRLHHLPERLPSCTFCKPRSVSFCLEAALDSAGLGVAEPPLSTSSVKVPFLLQATAKPEDDKYAFTHFAHKLMSSEGINPLRSDARRRADRLALQVSAQSPPPSPPAPLPPPRLKAPCNVPAHHKGTVSRRCALAVMHPAWFSIGIRIASGLIAKHRWSRCLPRHLMVHSLVLSER